MDGGNATIIAAVIAAVASLVSAGIALYNAKDSKKGAAQRDEVNNRTNSEIAMFEQDAENKRNETQIDASLELALMIMERTVSPAPLIHLLYCLTAG